MEGVGRCQVVALVPRPELHVFWEGGWACLTLHFPDYEEMEVAPALHYKTDIKDQGGRLTSDRGYDTGCTS